MQACCCALAGTAACWNCPNNKGFYQPYPDYMQPKQRKVITKEYDDKGRVVKETITIEPEWSVPAWWSTDQPFTTGSYTFKSTGGTDATE